MATRLEQTAPLLGGMRNVLAVPETAFNLAGNLFFDVGASGAEILRDPWAWLSGVAAGVMGDDTLSEDYLARRQALRDRLPTFTPTAPTAERQHHLKRFPKPKPNEEFLL